MLTAFCEINQWDNHIFYKHASRFGNLNNVRSTHAFVIRNYFCLGYPKSLRSSQGFPLAQLVADFDYPLILAISTLDKAADTKYNTIKHLR